MKRLWGIVSVFLPPILAGAIAFRAGGASQLDVVGALVFLWWVMSATLVIRYLEITNARTADRPSALEQLDVLTGTGRAIMWTGFFALVLATMNPIDHQGTYPLPAAQIDRFMVMLELGYPSPDDEVKVLDYHLGAVSPLASVRPVIPREAFIAWRETVPMIHVTPELKRVAVEYINGLRQSADESHAISPRATIAWVRASQARAMVQGREYVTIEDLLDVAPDVLRHRLWTDANTVRELSLIHI